MEFYKRIFYRLDFVLLGVVFLIIILSLFVLNSATAHLAGSFVKVQIRNILVGLCALLMVLRFDYTVLAKYTKYLYGLNLAILIAVLAFGHEAKGSTRWLVIPVLGQFQTSEFAKLLIIITLAHYLVKKQGELETLTDLIPVFIFVGVPLSLILVQPDLGTSLGFVAIMLGMLFVAGANPKLLLGLFGGSFLAGMGYLLGHLKFGWWVPLKPYQLNRILVVFDPTLDLKGVGWNVWQSKIAIGSGGFFGKGLGSGTQSTGQFLPEQWTDFIFAVLAEELGFLGGAILLVLYFVFLYRGIKIAMASQDLFGSLIATGIVSMFLFHIVENIGMTMGIMPVTGLPLPFVSYGGSNMLTNMIALGILLNIYVRRKKIIF